MADTLSRLSQLDIRETSSLAEHIHCVTFEKLTLPHKLFQQRTATDPVMSKVISYVKHGWPTLNQLEFEFHTYYTKRQELQVEHGLLLWRDRIIIRTSLSYTKPIQEL